MEDISMPNKAYVMIYTVTGAEMWVLIGRNVNTPPGRRPVRTHGYATFPGGSEANTDYTFRDTVIRECREETGINISRLITPITGHPPGGENVQYFTVYVTMAHLRELCTQANNYIRGSQNVEVNNFCIVKIGAGCNIARSLFAHHELDWHHWAISRLSYRPFLTQALPPVWPAPDTVEI
ncbi:NUDIX hydrolase [Salmonella enterica subsp. enterica serovar Anatum]|nr:NUDIX hydrolase [Salmonella enterica subsp. enterica serovar Anatum]